MKKQRTSNLRAIAFLAIAIAIGCETTNPLTQSNSIVFPDSNVSYSQHLQPVFNLNCTYSGCHDDVSKAGGLILTSWTNTYYSDPGAVVPGDTANSKLCAVLTRRLQHSHGGLDTNRNHIRGIGKWVLEGAKNN